MRSLFIRDSLLLDGDKLELAQDVLGQPGDLDTASCGLVRGVKLLVDGVELGKIAHVLQENLQRGLSAIGAWT
jgi:hypothetical protein